MEMEQLWGNVGVKCPIRSVIKNELTGEETVIQEGVEVTPSREAVVWSDHTRNFIIKRFGEVSDEALDIVKEQLDEKDFLKWIQKVKDVKSKMDSGENQVLRELSRVIDRSSLKPIYQNTKIKFENPDTLFYGFRVREYTLYFDNATKKHKVKREPITQWSHFNCEFIFYKDVPTSFVKDAWIHKNLVGGNYVVIEPLDTEDLNAKFKNSVLSQSYIKGELENIETIKQALLDSSGIRIYEDVVVTNAEDFEEELENAEEEFKIQLESAADRRKKLGQIPIHVMCRNESYERAYSSHTQKPYTFKQEDVYLADIQDREGLVVYGGLDDARLMMMMGDLLSGQFIYSSTYSYNEVSTQFNNDNILVIRLNKANERHFRNKANWIHVRDFFQSTTRATTPVADSVQHSETAA
jgi:hypothetical protein